MTHPHLLRELVCFRGKRGYREVTLPHLHLWRHVASNSVEQHCLCLPPPCLGPFRLEEKHSDTKHFSARPGANPSNGREPLLQIELEAKTDYLDSF